MNIRILWAGLLAAWMGVSTGCLYTPTDRKVMTVRDKRINDRMDDVQTQIDTLRREIEDLEDDIESKPAVTAGPVLRPKTTAAPTAVSAPTYKQRLNQIASRRKPVVRRKSTSRSSSRRSKKSSRVSLKAKHIRGPYPVKEVQQALKNASVDPGPIDGKVGTRTIAAIRQFQQKEGLKVDGIVGPATWEALRAYLGATP